MAGELAFRAFADERRALIGWAIALAAAATLLVAVQPFLAENADYVRFHADPPAWAEPFTGRNDVTDAQGHLQAEWATFALPLLLLVFGVRHAVRVIAADEAESRLSMLLAQPVRRHAVLFERAFGVLGALVVLAGSTAVVTIAALYVAGLGASAWDVIAIHAAALAFALFYTGVAVLAGALVASPRIAYGTALGLAALTFLVGALATVAGYTTGAAASPWDLPAVGSGIGARDLVQAVVLTVVSIALVALAAARFDRRDIRA